MIVTRSWLEEFIDLDGISNDELYSTFNRIGLEVDSIKEYTIPQKVVVGRIVACDRHPDADKLSLCQIDIGDGEPKQIICGAANVVDAEYVAVATIGAVLSGGLKIKATKLRGVESFGMVCSSTELGLPEVNDGIMILDDSIGKLEVGKELGSYPKIADTVIELELTANRGDCLSIHGVARDLVAAFGRPIKSVTAENVRTTNVGIARKIEVHSDNNLPSELIYFLAENEQFKESLKISLRLAFVKQDINDKLDNAVRYVTHATGVIMQAYDAPKLKNDSDKISLDVRMGSHGEIVVKHNNKAVSIVGIAHNENVSATDDSREVLFEASYIEPTALVESVASSKLKTSAVYYNTSRGSEPELELGLEYLKYTCDEVSECCFSDGNISVRNKHQKRMVNASVEAIGSIIGDNIEKKTIYTILRHLGFEIRAGNGETFGVRIPPHRHDIINLQDVAEEVLRMVGIDSIEAKPLELLESHRLSDSAKLYNAKRDMRQRAVSAGFYEAITYAFSDKEKLEKYGFPVTEDSLELVNPIVEELNTMRTTLMTNLLDAMKRNVSYGMKRIPLFEIGAVFDTQRNQTDKIAFVWSGQKEVESVSNQGKPRPIDFGAFVETITSIVGKIKLVESKEDNALIHPYQSATVIKGDNEIGYITKLHPTIAKEYDLSDTFLAELDLAPLLPEHILARPVSNYQGVYKDISVLVDKSVPYIQLNEAIASQEIPLLKKYYVVDVYEDDSLGESKSVTIRLFVQSGDGTLADGEIEDSVSAVLNVLEDKCKATLR